MANINQPPKQTFKSDIEVFAKAYFGIELTSYQLEYIRAWADPKKHQLFSFKRKAGITTADQVWREYIRQGLDPNGRGRMPMYNLPKREKIKGVTHEAKLLHAMKQPGGAFNFELSRIALNYTAYIWKLRDDGHEIIAERQFLKNGRASNTWKYRLVGE